MTVSTRKARKIAWRLSRIMLELAELEKAAPDDVDILVQAIISHLRSWRPVSVAPLGVLPPPGELPRDPRSPRGPEG